MINERSPVIRRSPQQHYQYDRFYPNPNPNPNPKLLSKQHASMDWTASGEPSSTMLAQPQFAHQQKDWGFNLAPSNTGSSASHVSSYPSGSASYVSAESRGGSRFKSRALELSSSSTAGATAAMRDIYTRTKVVVRHLPPGLSESAFMEQIASQFSTMYNMVSFCPGKTSIKGSSSSRAYIDFKHPEHVLDFYQGFNGHVFVNEKGTQYKALVEYAPNQRVSKLWLKKDPREGSIFQDTDYIKFTEQISKPVEFLPSAEAQLERKETERNLSAVAGAKEAIVITPLMEYVRQRRALKAMPQKSLAAAGKISVRGGASSMASSSKMVLKRGSRANSMYPPGPRPKEKATYVPRYEESQRRDEKKGRAVLEAKDSKNIPEDSINKVKSGVELAGVKGYAAGKKILDKEEPINGVALGDGKSGVTVARTRGTTLAKSPSGSYQNGGDDSSLNKSSQRIESGGGGRLSKGASSSRTPFLLQKSADDRDKRFSRSQVWKSSGREVNGLELESGASSQIPAEDKSEASRHDGRRLRNKDRPDRPVWTVRQRGDATESSKNFTVGPSLSPPGNQRQGRGPRDFDNNAVPDGSKPPSKRAGSSTVYGGHEKQVWVAKPGSGS